VIKSTNTLRVNNTIVSSGINTHTYENNQLKISIWKLYDANKKLTNTITTTSSYDTQRRPYKIVLETTEGEKRVIETTKWQGRYPLQQKDELYINNKLHSTYTCIARIDEDRVASMKLVTTNTANKVERSVSETYTYDNQDRKDPIAYVLSGDTEKYGENSIMHVYFLLTNTEQKDNLNNTTSNFKRSHEFNALGLVVKKTEEWVEDDNYHTIYEYEEY